MSDRLRIEPPLGLSPVVWRLLARLVNGEATMDAYRTFPHGYHFEAHWGGANHSVDLSTVDTLTRAGMITGVPRSEGKNRDYLRYSVTERATALVTANPDVGKWAKYVPPPDIFGGPA